MTGVGGIGKTRFVNVLGSRLLPSFSGRVWEFELASAETLDDILNVVCTELGLKAADKSPDEIVKQISRIFETNPALALLHSVESPHAIQFVSDLREKLRETVLVCTSRKRFNIPNSVSIRLRGLPQKEAVQLFVESAKLCHGRTIDRDQFVDELVARVDHIPLAIELLAARTRLMSAEVLFQRHAENPFQLVRSSTTDVDDRHQSLSQVISTSWDLLSEQAQIGATQLSILRAPVDIETLFAVLETSAIPEDVIEELWECSLLEWENDHFFLVRPVSEFASQTGDDDTLDRAKLRLASNIVERTAGRPKSASFKVASANASVALDAVIRHRDHDNAAPLLDVLRIAAERHGPLAVLENWSDRLLSIWPKSYAVRASVADARRWIDPEESLKICADLLTETELDEHRRASVLRIVAECDIWRGNLASALAACTESIGLSERLQNNNLLGEALKFQGIVFRKLGRIEEGIDALVRAVSVFENNHDNAAVAMVTGNLATLHYDAGDLEKAEELTKFAAETCAGLGLNLRASVWNSNLGSIQSDRGRHREAIETFNRSLVIQERVGDPRSLALTHHNLSLSYKFVDLERCQLHLEKSLALSEPFDMFDVVQMNLTHRANLFAMAGQVDESIALHATVIESVRNKENPRLLRNALIEQTLDMTRLGAFDVASAAIEELETFEMTELILAQFLLVRSLFHAHSGTREKAESYLEAADTLFTQVTPQASLFDLRNEILTRLEK